MAGDALFQRLLAIESRAGRLEGAFAADPDLGRMWRSGTALTEACRSVALEDIHVQEGDVIHRHLENRVTDAEAARGAQGVAGLLRVIAAPGDLLTDTPAVLRRCWTAAVSTQDKGAGLDAEALAGPLRRALQAAPTPFLGALKAAMAFRAATGATSPSADRLVFMAAEHALRGAGRTRETAASGPGSVLRRIDAGWIFLPSAALSLNGFRAWSPGTRSGLSNLTEGTLGELDQAIGLLPVLRRWRETALGIAERRNARSKLRDLVRLAMREPLLTPAAVHRALDVSRRASFTLMDEAEAAGILKIVTPRKTWRVWARPDMAARIAMRTLRAQGRPPALPSVPPDGPVQPADRWQPTGPQGMPATPEETEARQRREDQLLQTLDQAMARADTVIAKYARKDPTR